MVIVSYFPTMTRSISIVASILGLALALIGAHPINHGRLENVQDAEGNNSFLFDPGLMDPFCLSVRPTSR